jgi:hypothetical protein
MTLAKMLDEAYYTWTAEKARTKWIVRRGDQVMARFDTKTEAFKVIAMIDKAFSILSTRRALLADRPHPRLPKSNLTERDYVVWLLGYAGLNGVQRALGTIALALPVETETRTDNVIPFRPRGERPLATVGEGAA